MFFKKKKKTKEKETLPRSFCEASMWNLKYDTNELIYKTYRFTDRDNHLMITKGDGRRDKLGVGINIYTLLYIK